MKGRSVTDERSADPTDPATMKQRDAQTAAEAGPDRASHVLTIIAMLILIAALAVGVYLVREITSPAQPTTIAEATIADLETQIAADPANLDLRFRLADAYYRAKDYDAALSTLDDLRSEEVTGAAMAMVLYGTGRIEHERGNDELALDSYRQSLEFKDLPDARYGLAALLVSMERWDEAVAECVAYAETNPTDASAFRLLGQAYEGKGDTTNALAAYRQAQQFLPDDPEIAAAVARLEGQ